MNNKREKKFINIRELSEFIGIGIGMINKLIKEGKIPSYKIGKRRIFDREEIIQWVKTHREG